MAFVNNGGNVFGLQCNETIHIFPETSRYFPSDTKHNILSLSDNFPIKIDSVPENLSVKKEDNFKNVFTSSCVSDCGTFIAGIDLKKKLYLWKKVSDCWEPVCYRTLIRRGYKVIFTHSASEILVADRSGDVYAFSVFLPSEPGRLVLGHISIILDIAMAKTDSYIITCDRDGKIRVSSYPNSYNIRTYCLGHEEFVCALQLLYAPEEYLISSSGDGTLKLWNYENGTQVSSWRLETMLKDLNAEWNSGAKGVQQNSNNRPALIVKCIRYARKLSIVATLFHEVTHIVTFQVSCGEEIKPLQRISCSSIPVDVCFDDANVMWVVLSGQPPKIVSFQCTEGDYIQYSENKSERYVNISEIFNEILVSCNLSLGCDIDLTTLYNQCLNSKSTNKESLPESNEKPVKKNKISV